jgi:hypothetical protein
MSEVEQTTEAAAAPVGLGITDLLLMLQTVQVCAKRGAFRADEMVNIGGLHDRLLAFLEASGAITRETANAETANAETPEETASLEA